MRFNLPKPAHLAAIFFSLISPGAVYLYIQEYNLNLPLLDTIDRSAPIAFKVASGTIQPSDLFRGFFGHITATRHLLTLIMTQFTAWNIGR